MNMNTTTTQTQKTHGVGSLLAAPFVLSWEMVTFLWSVLMKIRAATRLSPEQQAKIDAEMDVIEAERQNDLQNKLNAINEEHQAVSNEATLGYRY